MAAIGRTGTAVMLVWLAFGLTVGLTGGPARASAGGYWRTCDASSSMPIGKLQTHHVRCGLGERLVKSFYRRAQSEGPHVVIRHFGCDAILGGVICERGTQRARLTGSPE